MSDLLLSNRRMQAAHLLRRAGFGGTSADIDEMVAISHAEAVDKLLNLKYDGNLAFNLERKLQENGYEVDYNTMAYWWMVTMARTRQPLQEKMTLFWHGHFTSSFSKVRDDVLLLEQNQLFRDNALGNFKDLVKKVSRNPAMLDYLDSQANVKGKPNENYARELMELFTIGIGNYTEQDVREAARAFTGWSFKDRAYIFNARQHDEGQKTFMGKTGNFNGDDIIDAVLARPESGRYIVSKLWKFFAYDNPEQAVVDRLTDIYFKNNYELKPVLQAIFTAPEFLSDKAYRALIKSPVEYVVGMIKDLGAANIETNAVRVADGMGQILFNPPTVKGWDGGLSWINSTYFFNRVNTAEALVSNRGQQNFRFSPYDLLGSKVDSAQSAVAQLVNTFLDGQTGSEVKAALTEYLSNGQSLSATDFTAAAANTANKPDAKALDVRLRGTLHLIMSSPDYMLK